ncbi:N-6 DNA methylase [Flavobacterium psychrophilum]|uniref:N-6 DNA methylase n=2 Tax=Flavobacterium psychrophilum TaxID=96345 RepID=UPI0007C4CF7F|nr:N-6 DNA methylase [Flavobacterium psychrophilum]EKT3964629.1 N-6 DNA methylase [Flavobacterium psychrophilum]EKT4518133.1 N-6 DNA methylase [Flavobacterium psychrophilum]ELM3644582.1 N-6 DNA methylase [Flavobacterium psychrophilum]MCB6089107.1 N-6 DNA methylase [Flavobacterium psychrophilum]MCB6230612.1 N-6 DNA methylase [Flavobacterium psychrophilum]
MTTEPIERDIETLIDLQLRKLGWDDNPKSPKRNIWKQQPKKIDEKKNLGGLKPDYILYNSNTHEPLIIIEAKRPSRDVFTALIQGKEYAEKINAPIVIATNGILVKAIHLKTGNYLILNGENVDTFFDENIALKFIENFEVETISKKIINSRNDLIKIFKEADNSLRKEGLLAGHERFSVFSNILFLKLMSEIQDINDKEGEREVIPKEYRWNFFKNKSGNELQSYLNKIVLKKFDEFYKSGNESIFDELRIESPTVLKEIINKLDQLELINIDSDIKGDAFEYFIRRYNAGEKDLGEYFTPRHIVKFLVQLLNPVFGEKIYDPFCGTGGMLIESFKHLVRSAPNNKSSLKFLKEESVYGREISSTAKIAKMNMILIGDGHNNIQRVDSLSKPIHDLYDIVISNIPFALQTEYGSLYDIPTKDANSICIQHCIEAIDKTATNGRIGLILPEKVLFDKNYEILREKIYENCTIENIISLPSGSFEPYTGVQTSILHLTKVKRKIKTNKVKFYFVKNDGYSLDKNRKKLLGENDLDNFFIKENDYNSLFINIDKIKNNAFTLQGKKYIPPRDLAEITFQTIDLIKLSTVLKRVKNVSVKIDDADDYNLLGVRSYGLGVFKKPLKGYDLSKGMSYFKSKRNHLFWCKVDTKNGAFGVVKEDQDNCIFTSNMSMLEIDENKIIPYFFEILFRNKKVQEYFDNYISGSTNRKYVKIDELLDFYIPNYTMQQQKKIVESIILAEKNIIENQNIIELNIEKTNSK